MSTSPVSFDLERTRLDAARRLPAHCFDDFLRLSRALLHGPAFQWLLVDAPSEVLRTTVMTSLDEVLHAAQLRISRLPLSRMVPDVQALEARLVRHAQASDVVHVIGRAGWFKAARWDALNVRRERIAAAARARLVFWLDEESLAEASRHAPDLWAWRGGVYSFVPKEARAGDRPQELQWSAASMSAGLSGVDALTMTDAHRRIAEIRDWLASDPPPPDELLEAPLIELGYLLHRIGDYDAALEHWRRVELPFYRRRGDERKVAITQRKIADVLKMRGQLDEALSIYREEALPALERWGDVRERADTQSSIADVLTARGQFDVALALLREDVLPAFERLGDMKRRAITLANIADVLQIRGQLGKALSIYRKDVLPAFERLDDMRLLAATQDRIADLLCARGEIEEALRIYREENLPIYERLGDKRAVARTHSSIAGALRARGQFDEALRIYRKDALPAFERLGDVKQRAITLAQVALILMERTPSDPDAAGPLLQRAHADLQRLGLPQAATVAGAMRALGFEPKAASVA